MTTGSTGLGEEMALTLTTGFLANGGETTSFTALVDGIDDPVDAGITTDGLVRGIDKDDFKVLVGSILVDPVRVEDTEVSALATDTFFSSGLERALVLELVHTFVDRLAIGSTLVDRSLTATTTDTDTVDHKSLLGLVSQTTSLVRARGARGTVDDIQLSKAQRNINDRKSEWW
jgi:hypothetical protein